MPAATNGPPTQRSHLRRSTGRDDREPERVDERLALILRWAAGAVVALLVVAAVVAFFSVDVCDQEVTSEGVPVQVCRHLEVSDPPVVAGALVVLAALGVFFTEISGFGFTLKREVRKATEKAEEAQAVAVRNTERIEETAGDLADLGQAVVERPGQPLAVEDEAAAAPAAVRGLAEEYNRIRLTMPSGSVRTAAMTAVVNRMISAFAEGADLDVQTHLRSSNRGLRLAAFASLYARPERRWATELVASLIEVEDKPFGQYWALRALRKQCEQDPTALDARTRRRLVEELQPRLASGSDRAVELRRLLEECAPG